MKFFAEEKEIIKRITKYPDDTMTQLQENQVNWLHGTNSRTLAVILQANMNALMPSGWLQEPKKSGLPYPLYPISGARDNGTVQVQTGLTGAGVNQVALSGTSPSGLDVALDYANNNIKEGDKHTLFIDRLATLSAPNNFTSDCLNYLPDIRRCANYAVMALQEEYLTTDNASNNTTLYTNKMTEIIQTWQAFAKERGDSDYHADGASRAINKCFAMAIDMITKNELPFQPNEHFLNLVNDVYPIVIGASVDPANLHQRGAFNHELAHEGAIPLNQIKTILVEEKNIEKLKNLLSQLKLPNIKIINFENIIKHETIFCEKNIFTFFINDKNFDDFIHTANDSDNKEFNYSPRSQNQ